MLKSKEVQDVIIKHIDRAKFVNASTIRLSDLKRRDDLCEVSSSHLEIAVRALKKKKVIRDYGDGIIYLG